MLDSTFLVQYKWHECKLSTTNIDSFALFDGVDDFGCVDVDCV